MRLLAGLDEEALGKIYNNISQKNLDSIIYLLGISEKGRNTI